MADYTYTEGDITGIMFIGYKRAEIDIRNTFEEMVKNRTSSIPRAPPCNLYISREDTELPNPNDYVNDIYSIDTILDEPDTVKQAKAESNLYRYFEFILVSDEGCRLRTKELVLYGDTFARSLYRSLRPKPKIPKRRNMKEEEYYNQIIIKACIEAYKEECLHPNIIG